MGGNQEFWEQLKQKYEEKNRILQQKEQELQLKLEAMNVLIEDRKPLPEVIPKIPSCTCPVPEEKCGFFSGLFSIFGSSKPKPEPKAPPDPSPPAPQDIPTKENSKDTTSLSQQPTKRPNCLCDPCQASVEVLQKVIDIPGKSSKDSGDFCNCSLCSRISFPGWTEKRCPCNLANLGNDIAGDSGLGRPETAKITSREAQKVAAGLSSPSKLSLKSMDLFYMQNIQDLASQQKNLLKHINDLEQKAKIYESVFCEYKNIDFSKDQHKCPSPESPQDPEQKTTAELKLENFLLKNELKDMRLEVRQYLERMEGPMQFKIESEKYKCLQLEQKLEEAARDKANLQELYEKEMNTLKMQLCNANANVYDMTAKIEQIEARLGEYQNKCAKLEDDLIRQKISEAETIKSLQAALKAQANANVVKDECDLHQIARDLSNILKECEPCGTCLNLPEDLTQAATLLKSLTDMIEFKLKKDESGVVPESTKAPVPESTSPAPPTADILQITTVQERKGGSQVLQGMSITIVAPPPTSDFQESAEDVSAAPEDVAEPDKGNDSSVDIEDPEGVNIDEEIAKGVVITEIPNEPTEYELPEVPDEPIQAESSEAPNEPIQAEPSEAPNEPIQDKEGEAPNGNCYAALPTTIPKLSCPCVNFKRSTQADQLWPKTDKPVLLKETELTETGPEGMKKKCDCRVLKKMKEAYEEEKCEAVKNELISRSELPQTCQCNPPRKSITAPSQPTEIAKLKPDDNERFKLSHLVTASRSREILKSETSIKCLKVKENFPFDVDTQVDILNKPPDGVHVTTTITNSGTLEVITEGPEGVIETTLVYTKSGNVEVVTEILQLSGKGSCKKKPKPLAIEGPDVKETVSEPGKSFETKVDRSGSVPAVRNTGCVCSSKCPKESTQKRPTCMCADCEAESKQREAVGASCMCNTCPVEAKQQEIVTGNSCICDTCPREQMQGAGCICSQCPSESKHTDAASDDDEILSCL